MTCYNNFLGGRKWLKWLAKNGMIFRNLYYHSIGARMHCKRKTHDHSKSPVVAASENPTEPWGRRPFHCPNCFQTCRKDHNSLNWRSYSNIAKAKADGRMPCKNCF